MSANVYKNIPGRHYLRSKIDKAAEAFGRAYPDQLLFCVVNPLLGEEEYEYENPGVVLLSPNHKLIFIGNNEEDLEQYVSDFISDVDALSKNFKYQRYIKRSREWKDRIVKSVVIRDNENLDFCELIAGDVNTVGHGDYRLIKYLISLITGSINELQGEALAESDNLLDEVKRKIVLFDADQTRFLYTNYAVKKIISVQGLSGTGKTELLLHKLREIYSKITDTDKLKIFFTCHNIALANELRGRIPSFFNKMRMNRQISWNSELWVSNAWGSHSDPDSGLYAYICDFYGLPFYTFREAGSYDSIFSRLKESIERIPPKDFTPCLDYILVDESQDFPEVFFDVCKKVVSQKVFTAGDVFQNIFYQKQERPKEVTISLHRCYRTDPRTLMFAHTLGLGLKERKRYNWFKKKEWEAFGYIYSENRREQTISLRRHPITRFEGRDLEASVQISHGTHVNRVLEVIRNLQNEYPNIRPGDIAVIMIDDDREIYSYMDTLAGRIQTEFDGWGVARGHEDKHTHPDKVYLTNTNNVKGLEFPFVICITSNILDSYIYRNKLYTMLTRSFITTYLLVKESRRISFLQSTIDAINRDNEIGNISIPNSTELNQIQHALIEEVDSSLSLDEILTKIFNDEGIEESDKQNSLKEMLMNSKIDKTDEDRIRDFIRQTKRFV